MARKCRALQFLAKIRKIFKKLPANGTILKAGPGTKEAAMDGPVVFLHGFSDTALFELIKALKVAARKEGIDPGHIAFASSTPTNRNWKIKDLIHEVRKEHEQMKKPPSP
jgi:hypothetical protein